MERNFNRRSAQQQRRLAKQVQSSMPTIFSICSPIRRCWEGLRINCRSTGNASSPQRWYWRVFGTGHECGWILPKCGECRGHRWSVGRDEPREHEHQRLLPGTPALAAGDGRSAGAQSGTLVNEQTPGQWLWRGRRVKLVDGTTYRCRTRWRIRPVFLNMGSRNRASDFRWRAWWV